MQRFFCDESSHAYVPNAPLIAENINKLSSYCNDISIPVISTRHINNPENAGMMDKWWRDIISKDSPMCELAGNLVHKGSHIIDKPQYDAFYKTDLLDYLNNNNIDQIVITGVLTHLCCETTARSAFVHGFEVFFVVDATASYNDNFHTGAVINLSHGFAHTVLTDEIIAQLKDLK